MHPGRGDPGLRREPGGTQMGSEFFERFTLGEDALVTGLQHLKRGIETGGSGGQHADFGRLAVWPE